MATVRKYVERNMENLEYHNFNHVLDVEKTVVIIVKEEKVANKEKFVLQTAAILHDIKRSEKVSAEVAKKVLKNLGYNQTQINLVADLILATKREKEPKNLLEKILLDADLDNLGREDFFERNSALRKEQGKLDVPDYEWHKKTYDFLKNHRYYTNTAQKLRGEGLKKNIERVENYLRKLKEVENAA